LWLVKREREREREIERLGDDDDDLLLLRGGGRGRGGLRRQEYAAWAVDSKAISWSFVQESGGFIYKSALFFSPNCMIDHPMSKDTQHNNNNNNNDPLSLSLSLIQTDYR